MWIIFFRWHMPKVGNISILATQLAFLDISTIVQSIPWNVENIGFLIVRRHVVQYKYYECYVKISQVMAAFFFKI